MKISELIKNNIVEKHFYGIELDQVVMSVPEELEFISFKAEFTDETLAEIDRTFYAKIANWQLAKRGELVIELPEKCNVDPMRIVQISSSMGTDFSLLPEDSEEYVQRVKDMTKAALSIPNRTNQIYPITPYLEYLALEALTGAEAATPNHHYVVKAFVETMDQELVEKVKSGIKDAVEEHFGTMEEFKKSVIACAIANASIVIKDLNGGE